MAAELHQDDVAVVEAIAAKDRSNLYLTSQFFAERTRYHAFCAMYAAMRVIDDAVDDVVDKDGLDPAARSQLHQMLDGWDGRIADAYAGNPRAEPLDRALAWALAAFPVPRQLWTNFVAAMHYDVDNPRFADFDAFLGYAEGATVAPTTIYIYLLIAEHGADGAHRVRDFDYLSCGRDLGIFAYLAHVLRDVRRDAEVGSRGLVYLSEADLGACGLEDDDLRRFAQQRRSDDRFARLVALVVEHARPFERRGAELAQSVLPRLAPDRRFILRLIVAYYQAMLARVAAPEVDLFAVDEVLSAAQKLAVAQAVAEETGFTLQPELLA